MQCGSYVIFHKCLDLTLKCWEEKNLSSEQSNLGDFHVNTSSDIDVVIALFFKKMLTPVKNPPQQPIQVGGRFERIFCAMIPIIVTDATGH